MKRYSVLLLNALPDKKTKFIGNRCMVDIDNFNILDYHVSCIKQLYHSVEIILVNGFDNKKIKKYVASKYKNIKCVDHDIDNYTNIGKSIAVGLDYVTAKNCLIFNTNNILHNGCLSTIKEHGHTNSYIIYSDTKGDVGIVKNKEMVLNAHYGLSNQMYEILYLYQNQIDTLKSFNDISKLYFFEILNKCIDSGLVIKPLKISGKQITIINSLKSIMKLKRNLCLI